MKILYVHERYGSLGGAEANAAITAGELRRAGHEVALLHGERTGKGEALWNETFAPVFPIDAVNSKSSAASAVEKFKPDVIYVHKIADLGLLDTLLESNVPLVRMVHDHDIYCMRSYKYNPITRRICTRAFGPHCIFPCGASIARNHAGPLPVKLISYFDKRREIGLNKQFKRMLVVTKFMREELLRNGFSPEKIEIFPPVPRMGDPSVRGSFNDRNLIIYAGQIIRGKGVDILLRSLAKVQSKFECIILGDGSHRAKCERLSAQLGLTDRVTFKGFIPQEELKAYYRDCSVVVISSVWPEPIATIGIEVMRYGLPVVAFDAGGIKDWLIDGENGYLVPWMNQEKFAQRVDQLLQDKALARRFGERGLQIANEQFDFPAYIARLEDLFRRVIQENSASPKNIPAARAA